MRTGLERLRFSPIPAPSSDRRREPSNGHFEETVAVEGQPFQIRLVYDRSGLRMTAFMSDATGQEETLGTAVVSHEVVNTDILRIVSIQKVGDSLTDPRLTLHAQLFEFATKRRLRVLPWTEHWNKMDPETRRWLDDNQLPDASISPSI